MAVYIDDLPETLRKQAREKYEKALNCRLDARKGEKGITTQTSEENAPNRTKYGNKRTEVDGIIFDSRKEADYYIHLKELEGAGIVANIVLQPRFVLIPAFTKNGVKFRKTEYVADFQYEKDGEIIVVDVKGYKTDVYKLKHKLFEYLYPDLTIREI